jgi:hypothetical protein
MELSFTELDNMNNMDNMDNTNNQYNYETYYENLIPKIDKQQMHENKIIMKKNQIQNPNAHMNTNTKMNAHVNAHVNTNINTNANAKINANKKILKPKRRNISYDDILSSMNTVVIDGKLEFIRKDTLQNNVENPEQNKKTVSFSQLPPQNNIHPQINKNSYIYNKYFKDYKDPNQVQNEVPTRPLTRRELIKQIIISRANAINERNRIAEIKSTKLLFNNNNNRNIVINSSRLIHNPNAMNHLFKFK